MLTIINPGRIVQIVDLNASRAAVVIKTRVIQAKFMTELMDEAVKNITADVCFVWLCIVELLTDTDIAVA